jgi:hypothetical protein
MSLENAQEMVKLLKSDISLATQYAMVRDKEEVLSLSIDLGEKNNLSFTKEEFEEALTSKGYTLHEDGSLTGGDLPTYVGEEGELDEEALEAVAGGICYSNKGGKSNTTISIPLPTKW